MKVRHLIILLPVFFLNCLTGRQASLKPARVVPTPQQVIYQQMELIGFVHFTVNTFTDLEWGEGTESPQIFNPTQLDARQWAQTAKNAGMKKLILTAKHHDGFCLWPSAYTEHSVKNSPWRNGTGDVVRDLADACAEFGLCFGVYLSPWDRHEPTYGTNKYNQFYLNQLEELLTQYGEICEFWIDGAKGENARDMEYDFDAFWDLVRRLQPNALMFSDAGPDIRWIGNEHGIAGETNWSMIKRDGIVIGKADQKYLNSGDAEGTHWVVGECDVSIRPGWFYHPSEDDKVKTPQQLVDLYYKSVGRNGTLLLNIPPDRRGLFHENDVAALTEFRSILEETFQNNLAAGAQVTASNQLGKLSPELIVDDDFNSYWAASKKTKSATLEILLPEKGTFDRIMLQEPIFLGQRISKFKVQVNTAGEWKDIAGGTTIGYKRLLKIEPVQTDRIRVVIAEANATIALSEFGLFKASERESDF
ncbi:alpha-L-fucosidase [candidate division KSB1 bacterium]|nr:alpha-L-fucosidase [candidate division KSB1 bacterium]